jgi:hypothetical protein
VSLTELRGGVVDVENCKEGSEVLSTFLIFLARVPKIVWMTRIKDGERMVIYGFPNSMLAILVCTSDPSSFKTIMKKDTASQLMSSLHRPIPVL